MTTLPFQTENVFLFSIRRRSKQPQSFQRFILTEPRLCACFWSGHRSCVQPKIVHPPYLFWQRLSTRRELTDILDSRLKATLKLKDNFHPHRTLWRAFYNFSSTMLMSKLPLQQAQDFPGDEWNSGDDLLLSKKNFFSHFSIRRRSRQPQSFPATETYHG